MILLILKLVVCAATIFYCGRRVARYGDAIAEKTGLGGLWIGVVLMAIATSLPELFTGIGSTVFVDAPDLTAGNLFGANSYNLLNLTLLDFVCRGSPLFSGLSSGQLLTGGLSLVPLSIAAIGILFGARLPQAQWLNVSWFSILIFATYLFCVRIIFRFEKHQRQIREELRSEAEETFKYGKLSLKTAGIRYAAFAVLIAAAGIWLAYLGDEFARYLGLAQSFIGTLFLGLITTLPEITVSLAALRLGAKELAAANMLGSNLFNMVILFVNDLFYRKAPIFEVLSKTHLITILIIFVMTIIVGLALILKPKRKTGCGLSGFSIALIAVFLIGTYLNFIFGR